MITTTTDKELNMAHILMLNHIIALLVSTMIVVIARRDSSTSKTKIHIFPVAFSAI